MTTKEQFEVYHRDNPQVYDGLKRLAIKALMAGFQRMGINRLHEILRWETDIAAMSDPEGVLFKLNNNYRPFYARLLMQREPELAGFFTTRVAFVRVRNEYVRHLPSQVAA